mmetsp:Transcript_32258/g.78458  ORF Transcript_32258/g.78458 Transcript_32258/m.78458 type:complete len:138 (-) Transcript_32258:458-871(-)
MHRQHCQWSECASPLCTKIDSFGGFGMVLSGVFFIMLDSDDSIREISLVTVPSFFTLILDDKGTMGRFDGGNCSFVVLVYLDDSKGDIGRYNMHGGFDGCCWSSSWLSWITERDIGSIRWFRWFRWWSLLLLQASLE